MAMAMIFLQLAIRIMFVDAGIAIAYSMIWLILLQKTSPLNEGFILSELSD